MNFCIYRQSRKEMKDGIVVYSGEDARPYASDRLIMIADGLGGSGAIRHLSIDRALFDRETILQALFGGVYEDLEDEVFASYVRDSFVELYPLREAYDKPIGYAIKKSSYLGSRIVCSALLYRMRHSEELAPDRIFDSLDACGEDGRAEYLESLGGTVSTVLRQDITRVAEKANIIYETRIPNLKLLATTLCATVVREREDFVEAVCFLSGDSRPYVWSEKNGLCQLIADQEADDGGMKGCVHLGEFSIGCYYFKLPKPCALFNASDGCFESGKFLSPMAFEKLVLDAVAENDSVEAVEARLISDYDTYGTHDDSSTLAMRCMGYGSFEDFRAACQRRLDEIRERYLSRMEGLLEKDFTEALQRDAKEMLSRAEQMKARVFADEGVRTLFAQCLRTKSFPKAYSAGDEILRLYERKRAELETELSTLKRELKGHAAALKTLVSENFIKFADAMGVKYTHVEALLLAGGAERAEKQYSEARRWYEETLGGYVRRFKSAAIGMEESLTAVDSVGIPDDFDDFEAKSFERLGSGIKYMRGLIEFLEDIQKRRGAVKRMADSYNAYLEKNRVLATRYAREVDAFCESEARRPKRICGVVLLKNADVRIAQTLRAMKQLVAQIRVLKLRLLNEMIAAITEKDPTGALLAAVDAGVLRDAELSKEAVPFVAEYREGVLLTEKSAALQRSLWAEYEARYGTYM